MDDQNAVMRCLGEMIVNPKCDECGKRVNPRDPLLGPHLCFECQEISHREFEAAKREFESQHRRRSVHIVKWPSSITS